MQRLRYTMYDCDHFVSTVNTTEGWVFTFYPFPSASCLFLPPRALCHSCLLSPLHPPRTLAELLMAPKRKNDDGTGTGAAARRSKKQAAAASGSTAADLKKGEGDWTSSSVKEATLTKLRDEIGRAHV